MDQKVTGVSGYLGGQIVHEALKAGYRVRGCVSLRFNKPHADDMYDHRAVRPTKVAFVQGWYTQYGASVEIVPLDLTNGDYSTVLKGNSSNSHIGVLLTVVCRRRWNYPRSSTCARRPCNP